MGACEQLPDDSFLGKNGRFNIALYEATFTAACKNALAEGRLAKGALLLDEIAALESDPQFVEASLRGTTGTSNVKTRLERASNLVKPL
jgi:uncharacterized membrane-anchored protein